MDNKQKTYFYTDVFGFAFWGFGCQILRYGFDISSLPMLCFYGFYFDTIQDKFCTDNFCLHTACLSQNKQLGISCFGFGNVTYNNYRAMAYRPVNKFIPCKFNTKTQIIKWAKLLVIFALIALIPFKTHQIYFLAPPLIVMFTELSNPQSPARTKPLYIIGLMTFASFIGCVLRLCLNEFLGLPLFVCTTLACTILFFAINKIKIYFPPAGAILLIPMILDKSLLIRFPLEVFIGAIILSFCALMMFREAKICSRADFAKE